MAANCPFALVMGELVEGGGKRQYTIRRGFEPEFSGCLGPLSCFCKAESHSSFELENSRVKTSLPAVPPGRVTIKPS